MSTPPYPTIYPDPGRAPHAAAAVLLLREPGQVYVVRRNPKLRFLGGFGGYPGGRVDRGDGELAGDPDLNSLAASEVAAARELFEEAGVLVCPGADRLADDVLDAQRKALLEGETDFGDLCRELEVDPRPAPGTLQPAGRWVTPFYSPLRFDTRYFVHLYAGEREPEVWPGELVEGHWATPREVIDDWERWAMWLAPPVTETLFALTDGFRPLGDLLGRLDRVASDRGHAFHPVRMRHGVRLLPLPSRTLPPAIYTNTYVVGERELLVVDPGASPGEARQVLLYQLDQLLAEGRRLRGIVLTHHHVDHVDSAQAIHERHHAPIMAHPKTAAMLADAATDPYRPEATAIEVGELLQDGQILSLKGGYRLEVVHTPGHSGGHICLLERASGSLLAGDLVSGLSPVIIDPPGGDMAEYLASLERATELGDFGLFPGHGPPHTSSCTRLQQLLNHRLWRQDKVLEALESEPDGATLDQLTPVIYEDVPEIAHIFAARSLQAHLDKLSHDGKVVRGEDGRYRNG